MSTFPIEDYFPHRGRMKLIDDIVEVDAARCVTRSSVSPLWPLVSGDRVDPLVVVELVAQSVAVYVGWIKREVMKQGGRGVLVGIKRAAFAGPGIPVGAEVRTTCTLLVNLDNYGEFEGEVSDGRQVYGSARLQTFQT